MKDVSTLVSGIEYKLGKLLETKHRLQAEIRTLKEIIEELNSDNQKQKETITQLEEKIKIQRLAKTIESKEGNVEAKMKINELVREIDKCIGLLNT